jgi:hypothetical protein
VISEIGTPYNVQRKTHIDENFQWVGIDPIKDFEIKGILGEGYVHNSFICLFPNFEKIIQDVRYILNSFGKGTGNNNEIVDVLFFNFRAFGIVFEAEFKEFHTWVAIKEIKDSKICENCGIKILFLSLELLKKRKIFGYVSCS